MATPFCVPENPRPPVKNSAAVAFFLLARITTTDILLVSPALVAVAIALAAVTSYVTLRLYVRT